MKVISSRKKIFYILILVALAGLMLGSSAYLQDALDSTLGGLSNFNDLHPVIGPFLFITLAALSILLGPFTSVPLVPFATLTTQAGLAVIETSWWSLAWLAVVWIAFLLLATLTFRRQHKRSRNQEPRLAI